MSLNNKHYYFIGIGGIGMGGLASIILDKGGKVSGSDLRKNQVTENLGAKGATIYEEHKAAHIEGADCVVYSSAIKSDNLELSEAERRGIKIYQRAGLLAELMRDYTSITVAGAHGKTTTTSMLACVLQAAELHPTIAVGGILKDVNTNAYLGTGHHFLAEVDESDGSFLQFSPMYSIITNIDNEHLDYYKNFNEIIKAYRTFISQTHPEGVLIISSEDKNLQQLVFDAHVKVKRYGFSKGDDVCAMNIEFYPAFSEFDCVIAQTMMGRVRLAVPGMHNVANALAAICLADHLDVNFDKISEGLRNFQGVKRRFEILGNDHGIQIIDDYAHHPTEIRCTLQMANLIKNKRLVTIFQPHRYSRFSILWKEFKASLQDTDYLVVTDVYAASEEPKEGVDAACFVEELEAVVDFPVEYVSQKRLGRYLVDLAEEGDTLLSLGAGDLRQVMIDLAKGYKETAVS